MKLAIGFVFGLAVAISISALAQERLLVQREEVFMFAGERDADGAGRMLEMTADGCVPP